MPPPFVVPDQTVPLLVQYMAETLSSDDGLLVNQANKYYNTTHFDRIPFHRPISLLDTAPTARPEPIPAAPPAP